MLNSVCPLCGSDTCKSSISETSNCKDYFCENYNRRFKLHTSVVDAKEKEKILYLITEFLLSKRQYLSEDNTQEYVFYYSEKTGDFEPYYVNTYDMLNTFPEEFYDKALRALMNLSKIYPEYGTVIYKEQLHYRAIFNEEELEPTYYDGGMYYMLAELGYLSPRGSGSFSISAEGWKKIDELKRKSNAINQGFIAMAFRQETNCIREAFRAAIVECGFSVKIIDEKEHNNQIVPEIFYEIERSKFIVVDVTYPNHGAYYEAGYAQALGKQVIICCREAEFKSEDSRPHFDISQKSMVVWKDERDLIARLKKRIEATVK